jgi:hypothetical protein
LPKHWNDARERRATKDFELKLWDAGQKATMAAALDLTAARVKRPNWPEFAEYDCFACHQNLGGDTGASDGLPQWNTWNFAHFESNLSKEMPLQLRAMDDTLSDLIVAERARVANPRAKLRIPDAEQAAAHWDCAVQLFLRYAALYRDRRARPEQSRLGQAEMAMQEVHLRELRELLKFEAGRDSPADLTTAQRDRIVQLFGELEMLSRTKGETP